MRPFRVLWEEQCVVVSVRPFSKVKKVSCTKCTGQKKPFLKDTDIGEFIKILNGIKRLIQH